MINSKNELNEFLSYELKKYLVSRWKCRIPFNYSENQVLSKFIVLLRKTEYCLNTEKKIRYLYYKLRFNRYKIKYSLNVPLNVIDKGFHIMHLGPVLINASSIGKDFSLHVNTCIVAGGLNSDTPTIGDGVVVGVGAVLLGGIKIANYTAIGANSLVNKDVLEENIAVAGVPAKKISNNGALCWNSDKKCGNISIDSKID